MAYTYRIQDLGRQPDFHRVATFLHRQIQHYQMIPAMLDQDRWGQSHEAILAETDDQAVGIVTLAFEGINGTGKPTIDCLYVSSAHRRKGVGYSLFERSIRRMTELGYERGTAVFQSSVMVKLFEKLPDYLRNVLDVEESYHMADVALDFEFLDSDTVTPPQII